MIRIGLLSDTHGFFDERINEYFGTCHEIWHAGDIGDLEIIRKLKRIASVVAVYGNIDGGTIRASFPAHQRQIRDGVRGPPEGMDCTRSEPFCALKWMGARWARWMSSNWVPDHRAQSPDPLIAHIPGSDR